MSNDEGTAKKDAQAEAKTDATVDAKPKKHRARATTAMVFVVIASIVLPLGVVTVWVRNMILNTERYVSTVSPPESWRSRRWARWRAAARRR